MECEQIWLSFYETSSELTVRLGGGDAEEILGRIQARPGILICGREPARDKVIFRIRCGMAKLTDDGPVPLEFENESERRGAWAGSFPAMTRAMNVLQSMPLIEMHSTLSESASREWFLLNLSSATLRSMQEPIPSWLAKDNGLDFVSQVLVRLVGEPEQLAEMFDRIRDEQARYAADEAPGSYSEGSDLGV